MTKSKKETNKVVSIRAKRQESETYKLEQRIALLEGLNSSFIDRMAECLLKAIAHKDQYTYEHSARVAFYSLKLGEEIGLSSDQLHILELSALFHDIGKIGVPDSVLLKPHRLDEHEFEIMKHHPVKSGEILQDFEELKDIAKYARHHHERYDGRGYPDNLKGEQIPLFSRIILIADTFDAMTSTRPYRKGLTYEVAFSELLEFSHSQFDPNLVTQFINAMSKARDKREEHFSLSITKAVFKKEAA